MCDLNHVKWESFQEALEKIAVSAPSAAGVTLAGTGLGAVTGAYNRYAQARNEGASFTDALGEGASGALKGGLIGTGVGAAAAGVSKLAPKGFSFKAPVVGKVNIDPARMLHDYGGHQLHVATGYGKARDFGAASAPVRQRIADNAKAMRTATGSELKSLKDNHSMYQQELKAWEDVEKHNLTNIPGIVKGMVKNPIDNGKRMLRAQWDGTTRTEKALQIGLPLALGGGLAYMAPEGHKLETVGKVMGSSVGGLLPINSPGMMAPMLAMQAGVPQVGMAASMPFEHAGGVLGSAVGNRIGRPQANPPVEGQGQ